MPPQLGMKKNSAKETSAIGVKISAKEIPTEFEMMQNVRNDRFQVLVTSAKGMPPQLGMKKNSAKETSAIGVKISAKEIPSELEMMQNVRNDRFQVLVF